MELLCKQRKTIKKDFGETIFGKNSYLRHSTGFLICLFSLWFVKFISFHGGFSKSEVSKKVTKRYVIVFATLSGVGTLSLKVIISQKCICRWDLFFFIESERKSHTYLNQN